MLKILLVGAVVSVIIGERGSQKGYLTGWIEGATILLTFFMITLIDAFNSRSCEEKIHKYQERMKKTYVEVYRDSAEPIKIN